MVSENEFMVVSGTALPDILLAGSGTVAKVLLCGVSGLSVIPLQVTGEGGLYIINVGSQAGI